MTQNVSFDLDLLNTPLSELNLPQCISIDMEESIKTAAEILQDKNVGCLLCTRNDQLAGIVTERDFLMKVTINVEDIETTSLSSVMTHHPFTLKSDEPVRVAMLTMNRNNFRHIPIIDDHNRPVAIVSLKDLMDFLLRYLPEDLQISEQAFDVPDHDDL